MDVSELSLVALGHLLQEADYRFISITPSSHQRVNARAPLSPARTLRDIFGWSRWFEEDALASSMIDRLRAADALDTRDGKMRSRVRYSTLGSGIYVHSAFPTTAPDAVFFGPDTYRFCAMVSRTLGRVNRLVDVGCGSGAGGLSSSAAANHVVLADISEAALSFARVNAEIAGESGKVETCKSDVLQSVTGEIDAVIANPPYLVDAEKRVYRDGGANQGTALALRIVAEALHRLSPGGRLAIYTGAPIVAGDDLFLAGARPLLERARARWSYEEIDPDVFGEELDRPAYAAVDRLAAVGLSATLPSS